MTNNNDKVTEMKLARQIKSDRLKKTGLIALFSLMLVILIGDHSMSPFGVRTAAADSHYGILHQQAPELGLNNWIDGSGEASEPVKLADHRGKVIYLYFFQDW